MHLMRLRNLIFTLPLIATACSQLLSVNSSNSNQLSGKISTLSTSSSSNIHNLSTCSSDKIFLHAIDSTGAIGEELVSTTVNESGEYHFKNLHLQNIKISNNPTESPNYTLRFLCGTEFLSRFVTSTTEQNIDYRTTILSWFSQTNSADTIKNIPKSKWIELYQIIPSSNSIDEAYQHISTNIELKNEIIENGLTPDQLDEAAPVLRSISIPQLFNEETVNSLSALVHHWSPNYSFAYEWRLNGQLLSNAINYNYIPNANSQGDYTLQFFVGTNNGSGLIDISKPYLQKIQTITISNTVLPTTPNLTLLSSSNTNSTAIQLRLSTGLNLENCRSFTHFAILDESAVLIALPPQNATLFNRSCTDDSSQDINFTLNGTEGPRALRLWSMDASGKVSNTFSEVLLNYDITAPQITYTNPAANTPAQNQILITGTCESGVPVNISGAGVTPINTNCTGGSFNQNVDLSAGDGVKTIILSQTDASSNTGSVSRDFIRDTVAPIISLSSPAVNTNTPSDVTISGSCESGIDVQIHGTGALPKTTTCSGGVYSDSVTLTTGDGTKNVVVTQTDLAGNSASANRHFIRDATAPVITIAAPAANNYFKTGATISGSCETGLTVTINGSGVNATTATCGASAYTQSVVFTPGDGAKTVDISQTDAAGNTTTVSRIFNLDQTPPSLQQLQINNGSPSTNNRNINLSFNSTSDRVDIHSICVKMNDNSAPLLNDPCWVTLSSLVIAQTDALSINDYPFQVGVILGTYSLRVWVKDDVDNISTNNDNLAIDLANIDYLPDPPAVISNVTATSTDSVPQPLTSVDTTVLVSADVFVKWNATDNDTLPNGNISIHYTTDEVNYTLIASGLNNAVNGPCTLDAGTTGCVALIASSPLSSYYKLRVSIEDSGGAVSLGTTNPLNTGQFNAIAGNTSLGLGGSAASAILLGRYESTTNTPDPQAFVVTKKGDIFFNYLNKGLAHISPITGMINIVAYDTNAFGGDNGPASSATFKEIRRIVLDYDENLLIWDDNKIRKIDLSSPSWTITTYVGGGADNSTNADALSALLPTIDTWQLFTVVPNGNIYFEKGRDLWYFDASDSRVKYSMTLTGTGIGNMTGEFANFQWGTCNSRGTSLAIDKTSSSITKIVRRGLHNATAACSSRPSEEPIRNASFDVTTGVATAPHPPDTPYSSMLFTGLDGRIYSLDNERFRVLRYNSTLNTFENMVGVSNTWGRCADGTPATSCPSIIMSAFVNEFGKLYYLDMGVIRTIDENGLVQTIAGQPRNFGIGSNPVSARFSLINFIDIKSNDVYVQNKIENQITKFSLNGSSLQHVAGNGIATAAVHGQLATTQPLQNGGWSMPVAFMVNTTDQRLYSRSGDKFAYIDLNTGLWNVSATQIQDSSSRVSYLGMSTDRLLAYVPSHFGATGDKVTLREIDFNGNSTIIYGQNSILTGLSNSLCDGVDPLTCTLINTLSNFSVQTRAKHHSESNSWLIGYYGTNYINTIPVGGGVTSRFELTSNGIAAFDYIYSGPDMILFYCSTNGNLYKRNVTTNVETQLSLPSTSIKCNGQSLHYDSGRNSLIFIFKQNDMYGIGEYDAP